MAGEFSAGRLADREGLGNVSVCGCGVVSINLAGISVRMEIGAFAQLEQMIREAADELSARMVLMEKGRMGGVSSMTH
jgi:hypothetical protein